MLNLVWTGVGVLFILWLLGFSIHVGGSLIHLLLVLALIGIVYNLFIGRSITYICLKIRVYTILAQSYIKIFAT